MTAMKKNLLLPVSCLVFFFADAQTQFLGRVKIEFEKTVYVKQLYKALEPDWYENIKDRLPEKSLTYFEFIGDTAKSVYKPGREMPYDARSFYQGIENVRNKNQFQ